MYIYVCICVFVYVHVYTSRRTTYTVIMLELWSLYFPHGILSCVSIYTYIHMHVTRKLILILKLMSNALLRGNAVLSEFVGNRLSCVLMLPE